MRNVDGLPRRHCQVSPACLVEVVQAAKVGDPVALQARASSERSAGTGELEEQIERATAVVEGRVPAVVTPHHRVTEAERGDGELDRHRRHVGRLDADVEQTAAVGEDVVDDRRVAHAWQEVGADHPLVVPGHDVTRDLEALRTRRAAGQRLDHPVVEPDERQVRLGDGEVLVVAAIRDQRLTLLPRVAPGRVARQVEPVHGRDAEQPTDRPVFSRAPSAR